MINKIKKLKLWIMDIFFLEIYNQIKMQYLINN